MIRETRRPTMVLVSACLIASFGARAEAGPNLLTNGGFETGNFNGWTLTNSNNDSVVTTASYVNSGTYGVSYGHVGSDSFLSQTFTTVVGEMYTFDFYQKTLNGTPNDFQAYWGGGLILDSVNSPIATSFTHYIFTETATSTSTTIMFGLRQDPGYSALDDVSVVDTGVSAVPEPSSLILTSLPALLGLGCWARNRRKDDRIDRSS